MVGVHRGMIMNQLHIHGSCKLFYFKMNEILCVIIDTICSFIFP
jgi:hypothetical protein